VRARLGSACGSCVHSCQDAAAVHSSLAGAARRRPARLHASEALNLLHSSDSNLATNSPLVLAAIAGVSVGIGAPILFSLAEKRDKERIEEIRELNRATLKATGATLSEVRATPRHLVCPRCGSRPVKLRRSLPASGLSCCLTRKTRLTAGGDCHDAQDTLPGPVRFPFGRTARKFGALWLTCCFTAGSSRTMTEGDVSCEHSVGIERVV
jgi:hypothetical protein